MHKGLTTLGQLIDLIRHQNISDAFTIYADQDVGTERSPTTQLLIEAASTFDVDGNEVLPQTVRDKGFEPFCSLELLESVVQSAVDQKPSASNAEIVEAFDYYMENDDFLDL